MGAPLNRLPVLETVGNAYRFLFREFPVILRLAWFPLLVVAVIGYVAAREEIDALVAAGALAGAGAAPAPGHLSIASGLADIIAFAVVGVAIHRLALFADRKPGTFVLFAMGRAELLFMAIPLALTVVAFAASLAAPATGTVTAVTASPVQAAVLAAAAVAVTWLVVRLALLYPVIVVEERFDWRQSFDLSRGNFWRLLAMLVLAAIPVAVVSIGFSVLSLGFLASPEPTVDPATHLANALRRMLIYQAVFQYVMSILVIGLTSGLACYAYKALTGQPPDAYLTREYEVRP